MYAERLLRSLSTESVEKIDLDIHITASINHNSKKDLDHHIKFEYLSQRLLILFSISSWKEESFSIIDKISITNLSEALLDLKLSIIC